MAPLRLLAQLRQAIRVRHYSRRTEEAYVFWVRRYVRFCGLRHPGDLGPRDVREFLTALAERERLSAASQNQAASALVSLYERVLGRRLSSGAFEGVVRAKEGQRRGGAAVAGASVPGAAAPPAGCRGGRWTGIAARGVGAEGTWGGAGLGVAVGVSCGARASTSRDRLSGPASLARIRGAAGRAPRGVGCGDREAGRVSHVSALVRDAFDRGGVRYSDYPGAVGAS